MTSNENKQINKGDAGNPLSKKNVIIICFIFIFYIYVYVNIWSFESDFTTKKIIETIVCTYVTFEIAKRKKKKRGTSYNKRKETKKNIK